MELQKSGRTCAKIRQNLCENPINYRCGGLFRVFRVFSDAAPGEARVGLGCAFGEGWAHAGLHDGLAPSSLNFLEYAMR